MVLGVWQAVMVKSLFPTQLQLPAFVFEDALLLTIRVKRIMKRYSSHIWAVISAASTWRTVVSEWTGPGAWHKWVINSYAVLTANRFPAAVEPVLPVTILNNKCHTIPLTELCSANHSFLIDNLITVHLEAFDQKSFPPRYISVISGQRLLHSGTTCCHRCNSVTTVVSVPLAAWIFCWIAKELFFETSCEKAAIKS